MLRLYLHVKIGLCFCIGVLMCASLRAQTNYASILREWVKAEYFKHASVGVSLKDIESGKTIAGYADQRSLIPASNLKILTTVSALAMLGADYRYTTEIAYDGDIDAQGVLQGNLYIVGSGDPSLASPKMDRIPRLQALLERFVLAVQRAGIRQIAGRIIADDTAFSSAVTGSHWQWLDLGNYYGCGAFGLNVHDNLYYLDFRQQTQLGAIPTVTGTRPSIPGLQFINEVESGRRGSGDNAYIYGAPYTYQRYLRGTIPIGSGRFTIKGAIPDPPLLLAQRLQKTLETVGILAQRPPATQHRLGSAVSKRTVIHTYESPPLSAIVERTNMESVNLYAESLLRTIGLKHGSAGDAMVGLQALQTYWEAQGLSFAGVQLYDGSGMAPRNVFPTSFMTDLLQLAFQKAQIKSAFWESLPVAGQSGSLRNQLKEVGGRVRAKSGSLERVRGYSGYLTARSGKVYAFSILINNYEGSGGIARRKIMQLLSNWAKL